MPNELIPNEVIKDKIFLIRKNKVILDKDLAKLYGVEVKVLNQAVRRNIERFPQDFAFQLSKEEVENLKSQNVTSSWGGTRKLPYAFTEQGIAMTASVLKNKKAILINVQIVRIFIKLRKVLISNSNLKRKIENLEKKYDSKLNDQDTQIKKVFEMIKLLIKEEDMSKKKMGFIK